jgi:hypothetical protein
MTVAKAPSKPAVKGAAKGAKKIRHGYSQEDLIKILEKCIPIYKRTKNVLSFHQILSKHCTYSKAHWNYWLHEKKDVEILAKFKELRDIQEDRIVLGGASGMINTNFAIFLLKSKFSYIEKQHADRLELDKKRLEFEKDLGHNLSEISINVVPIQKRES